MENKMENKKPTIARKLLLGFLALAMLGAVSWGAILAYQALSGLAYGNVEQGLSTTFDSATFGSTANGSDWNFGTLHGNDAVNLTFSEANSANRDTTGTFAVVIGSNDSLTCNQEIQNLALYPDADGMIDNLSDPLADGTPLALNCITSALNEITYTASTTTALAAGSTLTPEVDFEINPLMSDQSINMQIRYD